MCQCNTSGSLHFALSMLHQGFLGKMCCHGEGILDHKTCTVDKVILLHTYTYTHIDTVTTDVHTDVNIYVCAMGTCVYVYTRTHTRYSMSCVVNGATRAEFLSIDGECECW